MIVSVQGGGLLGADERGWLPNATMPQSRGEGADCAARLRGRKQAGDRDRELSGEPLESRDLKLGASLGVRGCWGPRGGAGQEGGWPKVRHGRQGCGVRKTDDSVQWKTMLSVERPRFRAPRGNPNDGSQG